LVHPILDSPKKEQKIKQTNKETKKEAKHTDSAAIHSLQKETWHNLLNTGPVSFTAEGSHFLQQCVYRGSD
jgi:hypothetical protein